MKHKRKTNDYSKLSQAQSEFICNQVWLLGSVEAVGKHYNKKCLVDDFAKVVAEGLFGGKGGRKWRKSCMKALALLSGGLDSTLATKMIQEQGMD